LKILVKICGNYKVILYDSLGFYSLSVMFPLRNLFNRRVIAGIVASVLTVSIALIAKSNLPTEARSRVYKTERITQKWRSPSQRKHRVGNYRTSATKRKSNSAANKVQLNKNLVSANNRPQLRNNSAIAGNKSVNQVAQRSQPNLRTRTSNYSTPVTNRFGATGSRPSSTLWRAEIKRRYGIGNHPTPVTNRFNRFASSGRKFANEPWRAAIKRNYGIDSSPTPVTDRFGANGSRPSSELWRAEIKRRYGIGNTVRQPVDEQR
jgi:hypothetical protein